MILFNQQIRARLHLSSVIEKRGTTVMLFVASFAFLLLLGPFYGHWCITYLFHNYSQCHFTRNIYENVQVCMGVFHPYLTVIEKGMRECNHAVNFIFYMATSARFRSDFKRLCHRLIYRVLGSIIIFLYKLMCSCCTEPSCLITLEQHLSDTSDLDSTLENNRKNQTAYKTSHYYHNYERRRQHQLLKTANDIHQTTTTMTGTPSDGWTTTAMKPIRTQSWNSYDRMKYLSDDKRQAARLSQHFSTSGVI
jgi:hypothetical protein